MATLTDKWYKEVSQRSTTEESEEDDLQTLISGNSEPWVSLSCFIIIL